MRSLSLAAGLVLSSTSVASAQVLWDEAVNGDISSDRLNPTTATLSAGTHSLSATSGGADREYITITIPDGLVFSALINVSYEGIDPVAFAGIQAGPIITQAPDELDPTQLLGWAHFGPGLHTVGEDFLDDMGIGFGAIGFTPPLPSGTYALWLQQTGDTVSYQIDFVIVPAPSALALAALGVATARRRR